MAYISELNLDRNLLDADGFLPTSQKIVIGNYVQDKDNLPLLIDRVNGGSATQTWTAGVVAMAVTANVADYAIAQTRICHPYISSHPSVYTITFNNFQTQANVVKRVGAWRSSTAAPYTANYDGIYLESDGTTYNIVIAKNGVLNTIPRVSLGGGWDDPLDGTGASAINYDFSKFTVLQIDFLYLGGTWVRFGLVIGGEIVYFHTYKHSGTAASTFVNSPYFYIRWELRSTGGAGNFGQICGAFSVLGGKDTIGREIGADMGASSVIGPTAGTEYLLLAIRLKSAQLNSYVSPVSLGILSLSKDPYLVRMRLNPTIAGAALTWNNAIDTPIEYAIGNAAGGNTITATTQHLGCWNGAEQTSQLVQKPFVAALGSNINGTSGILTFSLVPITNGAKLNLTVNLISI